jgi:hypothetical protein
MSPINLTPEQEVQAQRLADLITTRTRDEVLQIARLLASKADTDILGATEFDVRDRVHKIGAQAIETALNERKKGGYKGSSMTCPQCQEAADFKGYCPKTYTSLLNGITLSRPYYHCTHCGHGHFPWDGMLSLTNQRFTLGAREVMTLAGVQESFAKAADRTLVKLAGLTVSESSVERITETAGAKLDELLHAGKVFGDAKAYDWHVDARGKRCAYVSVDWTGIMMQGPGGAKAEGRMVAVGMVFNPLPRSVEKRDAALAMPCNGVRYLSGYYPLEELGLQLRRQATQVGMDSADLWIALTDGGNGLENFIDVNFPCAVKILDIQHPAGRLSDLAKLVDPEAGDALATKWCHIMKHEGGRKIVSELEALDRRRLRHAARDKLVETLNYLQGNLYRMNYPKYLERGWQIATGAVESACKTVINQRLAMGGMRWGEEGSNGVAHLRALYRSDPDQWDSFWAEIATAA